MTGCSKLSYCGLSWIIIAWRLLSIKPNSLLGNLFKSVKNFKTCGRKFYFKCCIKIIFLYNLKNLSASFTFPSIFYSFPKFTSFYFCIGLFIFLKKILKEKYMFITLFLLSTFLYAMLFYIHILCTFSLK